MDNLITVSIPLDNLITVSIPEYHLNKWMLTNVQVPRSVANRLQIINSLTLSLLIWDVNGNDDGPSELLKSVSNHNTQVLNEYGLLAAINEYYNN